MQGHRVIEAYTVVPKSCEVKQCVVGSDCLQNKQISKQNPECVCGGGGGSLLNAMKVKPKLPWKHLNAEDARTMSIFMDHGKLSRVEPAQERLCAELSMLTGD